MSIIVTGSIAWDVLMRFPGYFQNYFLPDHLDNISVSFLVDEKERHRGGCAPNIAYSLALLGSRPKLMGWLKRIHSRPAYKRALERGGPYSFAE